jgi:hypothetical protein
MPDRVRAQGRALTLLQSQQIRNREEEMKKAAEAALLL